MLSLRTPADLDLAVDLTTANSALTAADRLCETANRAGIFLREGDPERDAATCKAVRCAAKDWLKSVRKHIDSLSVADALRLLPSYDTLHRVVYGTPADPAFLNRHVMAAFEARIRGDKEVDPYLLYRQINAGIARRDPLYLGRPLAWSTTMLDRWYKEFSEPTGYSQNKLTVYPQGSLFGKSLNHLTEYLYDRIQKASILMDADLWMYEGANQNTFKQHLCSQLEILFYKTDCLDLMHRGKLSNCRGYLFPCTSLMCSV